MDSPNFEKKYVIDAYNQTASEFNVTRAYSWKGVKEFIDGLDEGSEVLDVGCGNGRNMKLRDDCHFTGVDNSEELVKISRGEGLNVQLGDLRNLEFPDDSFDAVICIAVIHHISDANDCKKAVSELLRVVKPQGRVFIQVWSTEAANGNSKKFKLIDGTTNDYLISWNHTIDRYYHLYSPDELKQLVESTGGFTHIIDYFNEKQNWCIIIEK
jgi:ubiquinone/menaquinone biosynthesis C-methylase UbiE